MAAIDTHKVAKKDRPSVQNGAATPFRKRFSLAAGNQNDTVSIVDIPHFAVVRDLVVTVGGTLGSSCTILGARGATALTGATTAAGADREVQTVTDVPSTSGTEDVLNVTIGGANVAATAVVTVDCNFVMLPASGSY